MRPAPPSERQTLSYLRNLFEERGIRPKNKLGQNFLIDLNLLDVLLRAAELGPEDLALEVGSGTGSLTVRLAEQAGGVVSVEVDPAFGTLTEEAVHGHDNAVLLHTDVLKNKNEISPEVLRAVEALARRRGTTRLKLVANLPYAVAVPVISNLLIAEVPVERMVVTVQWEIAERLMAPVGTKPYGALAVLVQSLAEVGLVRRLPPASFWPRPLVSSAIVCLRPDPARRARVGDVPRFRHFLRDLYVHRRKNLRGALASLPGRSFSRQEVDARLAGLGIDGTTRAEALDLEQHLRLSNVFGGPGRVELL
jgi:16S rRNA (adenine1518-N6/adenine1519-N6)-dimethyltransferase